MDKVEKFKELLEELEYTGELIGRSTTLTELEVHMPKKIRLEQELIKMYDEKQEKPVIYCREYEVIKIEDKLFYVLWQGKFDNQTVVTHALEEKDGMLITDDFIFVKTD